MRKQLEAAADKSRRSASQELLRRLYDSFGRDRDKDRDRAVRAVCFLISELKNTVACVKPAADWHRDPFLFRAFKIAVGRLLDAIEPSGEMLPPPPMWTESSGEITNKVLLDFANALSKQRESPQRVAENAVRSVLLDLGGAVETGFWDSLEVALSGHPAAPTLQERLNSGDEHERDLAHHMKVAEDRIRYGMADVRRDLGLALPEGISKPKDGAK